MRSAQPRGSTSGSARLGDYQDIGDLALLFPNVRLGQDDRAA